MGARRAGNRRRLYSLNKLGQSVTNVAGQGVASGMVSSTIVRDGHQITTEFAIDLSPASGGFRARGTSGDIIGLSGALGVDDSFAPNHQPAGLGRLTISENGHLVGAEMVCLEAPLVSNNRINLVLNSAGTLTYDSAYTAGGGTNSIIITGSAAWALGDRRSWSTGHAALNGALAVSGNVPEELGYVYLFQGDNGENTPFTYSAGKYVIRFYGIAVPEDK